MFDFEFSDLKFIIIITFIMVSNLILIRLISKRWISPALFFWSAWMFAILSALFTNNNSFFEYDYPIDFATKQYILIAFSGVFLGFPVGSLIYNSVKGKLGLQRNFSHEPIKRIYKIEANLKYISLLFLSVGLQQFITNLIEYGSLSILRGMLQEISEDRSGLLVYFFYLPYLFLIYLGYIDSMDKKVRWKLIAPFLLGLLFYGLSSGARQEFAIGFVLYGLSRLLFNINYINFSGISFYKEFRKASRFVIIAFIVFATIGMIRAGFSDRNQISQEGRERFYQYVVFSIFWYVTESLVSTGEHANNSEKYGLQYGRYTLDGPYRLLKITGLIEGDQVDVFEHDNYILTSSPYGWSQTNSIPKMIADFGVGGSIFGFFLISLIGQYLGLACIGRSLFNHSIGVVAYFSMIYSIQGSYLFSANALVILFFGWLLSHLRIKF
jgi:oligosaccharide repeat unit polymerase